MVRWAWAAVLAVGCGASDPGGGGDAGVEVGGDGEADAAQPPGSCNVPSQHTCVDYTGTAWGVPSSDSNACAMVPGGAYSPSACPGAPRVGTCVTFSGQPQEVRTRFYAPLSVAAARPACTALIAQSGAPGAFITP